MPTINIHTQSKELSAKEDFDFDALRECDKLVLLVRAGAKNGKKIERAVEQIRRQDLEIGGAFLFDEDKKLIKQYYR